MVVNLIFQYLNCNCIQSNELIKQSKHQINLSPSGKHNITHVSHVQLLLCAPQSPESPWPPFPPPQLSGGPY